MQIPKTIRHIRWYHIALSAGVLFFLSGGHAADLCSAALKADIATASTLQMGGRYYAKGIDAKKTPDGHFQISYEAEYTFSEIAPLLRDYAPSEDRVSLKVWKAMTDAERVQWTTQNFPEKPEYAALAGFHKIVDIKGLPDDLVRDPTGNLEIVVDPPLDTYEQWETLIDTIVQRYGVGSQQAMVSKPRQAAFGDSGKAELTQQSQGWLIYTNLFDTFEKLASGYKRYQQDPTKEVASSFDHAFLGPMTLQKRSVMEKYLQQNATLGMYDQDSKKFVRNNDASFKYTGGPAYRPDIAGPDRFAWEIRNAHKDLPGLKRKVLRDLRAHGLGLEPYAKFANVPAFDTEREIQKLSPQTQAFLKTIFPSKADPRFENDAAAHLALETYRNFSMPMMDFTPLIGKLLPDHASAIRTSTATIEARSHYVDGLASAQRDFAAGKITAKMARARVMGLLAEWSVRSGITSAFATAATQIGHDPAFVKQDIAKVSGL